MTIRQCKEPDVMMLLEIINAAARIYQGVIPDDRYHDPYMPLEKLRMEIEDGVVFWGLEKGDRLLGVMGIQDKGDVALIRHAYVQPQSQRLGIGTTLLHHLESMTAKPILVGTWAKASWAIAFYQKNDYTPVSVKEKNRLLHKYWSIPERQVQTSVVLANQAWLSSRAGKCIAH